MPQAEIRANAKLIAAAPETLEALIVMVEDSECYCSDTVAAKGPCGYCVAKGVIAKATSEKGKASP